jgi:two-component system LytT family response regulator
MSNKAIIRCMVIDDEPLALQLISDYVLKAPALELVYQTTNPVEALPWAFENKVDVVFLDIHMPELSGMNFLKLVQNKCKVVLITAYHDYALEGYEHDVIDYLLKPVTLERFMMAVHKITERINPMHADIANNAVVADHIFVKTEYKIQKIDCENILYLEGLRDYVAIHTTKGKILSLQSMRTFEERLPANDFIRIHKSYIVAIKQINFLEKNRVVIQDQYLPVGDTYKDALLQLIRAV